jgi:ADP-heptose:LPS heptosyltransferase
MKILFFRLGAVGDCLLTTPAVRYIKSIYPDAVIHYMAGAPAAPVLENNPYIDRVMPIRLKKHILPREFGILFIMKELRGYFRGEKYDYFIDFESSYFSAYVSLFACAKVKIGHLIKRKSRRLYNLLYQRRLDFKGGRIYSALRQLALVKMVKDGGDSATGLVLSLTAPEKEKAALFYSSAGIGADIKKILFGISGTWPSKSWPEAHWIRLAELLAASGIPHRCVVLWGPGDNPDFLKRLSAMQNVSVIPAAGLREFAAIISGGDVIISNDSAARHIADAFNVKTIGLFGPTDPLVWAKPESAGNVILTPGVDCAPCDLTDCGRGGCMDKISPETVYEEVKKML